MGRPGGEGRGLVTCRSVDFVEILQQPHAPAIDGLGQAQQGVELAPLHLLEFFAGRAFVDHAPLVHDILQAIGHPGVGRSPVAAGASGLLVIGLDVLGHVQVGDKAHIGLVDAHAERNRRHHDHRFLAQESVLVLLSHLGIQPGVVRQGLDALIA